MTDPALQADFAEDVVLLKLVGMNPVVVHGGGPQIEEALGQASARRAHFIQGMRVTDEETMEVVEWVLAGEVQQDIVGLINSGRRQGGGPDRPRRRPDPRAQAARWSTTTTRARSTTSARSARSSRSTRAWCKALQDDQFIPVISPIGFGDDNESYNINADVVAGKLAEVLKAEKLMLLTNTPGVLDKAGKLLTDLTRARDRRAVRRRHHLRRHAAQDRGRRSTPPRAASTPCTSSTAGCRTRCCWRS